MPLLRHRTLVYGPIHVDEHFRINTLGGDGAMHWNTVSWLVSMVICFRIIQSVASQLSSLKAWREKPAASWALCMSARFCWTKWCKSVLLGYSGAEYSIYVEVSIFVENKKVGCVTCRLIDWGTKCHHHIWELLSPVPLEVIHSLANMFSKVLFIRWIRAFDSGWKNVVRVSSFWRDCIRLWKSSCSKFWPWSVRMKRNRNA